MAGFYPNRAKIIRNPEYCRPCQCDPKGATSSSCNDQGRCICRKEYTGTK